MDSHRPKKVGTHGRDSLSRAERRLGANHLAFAASFFGLNRRRRPSLVANFGQRESLFDELSAKYSSDDARRLPELSMLYRLLGKTLASVYLKWLAAIDFSLSQTQLTFPQFISQTLLLSHSDITHTNISGPHVLTQTFADNAAPSLRPSTGYESVAPTRELVRPSTRETTLHTRESSRLMFAQLERLFDVRHRQENSGAKFEPTRTEQAIVERTRQVHHLVGRMSLEQKLFAVQPSAPAARPNVWETINRYLLLLVAPPVAPARARRDAPGESRATVLIDQSRSYASGLLQIFTSEQIAQILSPAANAPTLFSQEGRERVETTSFSHTLEAAEAHNAPLAFGSLSRQMTALNVFAETALEAFLPASYIEPRIFVSKDKNAAKDKSAAAAVESLPARNAAGETRGYTVADDLTGAGKLAVAREFKGAANIGEFANARNNINEADGAQREGLPMPLAVRQATPRDEQERAEFTSREAAVLRGQLSRLTPLATEAFTRQILQTLEVMPAGDVGRRNSEPANGRKSEYIIENRPARAREVGSSVAALILRKFNALPSATQFMTVSETAFVRTRAGSASAGGAASVISSGGRTTSADAFPVSGVNLLPRTLDETFVIQRTREAGARISREEGERILRKEGSGASPANEAGSRATWRGAHAEGVGGEAGEPLVLLRRIVSRAEREMLARMGRQPDVSAWMRTGDAMSARESDGRNGWLTRERASTQERRSTRERESIAERERMPLVSVRTTPFAAAQRFERSRVAAAAESAAKASAAVVAGEMFRRSLNIFRAPDVLKISVQRSGTDAVKLLSERGAQVSFLLAETFVTGGGSLSLRAARAKSARGLKGERSLRSEGSLETFADGVERMSKVLLRRRMEVGGGWRAGESGGVENGRGVAGVLASRRQEETARTPDLRYVFTMPTPRPSVAEQKVIREVEQKEVVELVQREVRTLMSSNTAAASMKLTRGDYSKISEQVYSTLVRRLMAEKERLGLHNR